MMYLIKQSIVVILLTLFSLAISLTPALAEENKVVSLQQKVEELIAQKGESHDEAIEAMKNLADAYSEAGRYKDVLFLREKLFSINNKRYGEKHVETIFSMNKLGAVYLNLGQNTEAITFLEKGLNLGREVLGEKNSETISSLNNLAAAYLKVDRNAEARVLLEKGLGLCIEVLGAKHPETITSINNLAAAYLKLGLNPEALMLLEKSVKLHMEVYGESHPNTIDSMNNLAIMYLNVGRTNEALPILTRTLKIRAEMYGEKHPNTISSMNNLAYIYLSLGRSGEGLNLYEKAIDGVEYLRRENGLSVESRQALFAEYSDMYKYVAKLYINRDEVDSGFTMSELSKARTLLESASTVLADQSSILQPDEAAKLREYNTTLSRLNEDIAKNYSQPEKKVTLEVEKKQLLQDAAAYRQMLSSKYPKYAQMKDARIISAGEGRQLIPADAVFISYLMVTKGDTSYITAFTLDTNGQLQGINFEKIPNLEKTLIAYTKKMQGKQAWLMADGSYSNTGARKPEGAIRLAASVEEISRYLGQKLLAPLQEIIQGKRHLIISSDGALAMIPFETLAFHGNTVIDEHNISYIQSLSMLTLLNERDHEYQKIEGRNGIFAMGAAEYKNGAALSRGIEDEEENQLDDETIQSLRGNYNKETVNKAFKLLNIDWHNLPSSEMELNNVATIFGNDSTIYKKEEASEAKLLELNSRNELSKYRYLLFSTHGYFCTQEPALSAVVLNQVNTTANTDGYITAAKWPSYNLKSDLMVLSACETGVGKVVHGEGIIGLPFALYVAGNKNTVFTLWPVVDESSTKFTESFFMKVKAGKSHIDALNETKREFKNNPQYARPLYWAPYVFYGI